MEPLGVLRPLGAPSDPLAARRLGDMPASTSLKKLEPISVAPTQPKNARKKKKTRAPKAAPPTLSASPSLDMSVASVDAPPDRLEESMDGSVVMAMASPERRTPGRFAADGSGSPGPARDLAPALDALEEPAAPPALRAYGDAARLGSVAAVAGHLRVSASEATRRVLALFNETWRDFDGAGRAPAVDVGDALSAAEARRLRGPLRFPEAPAADEPPAEALPKPKTPTALSVDPPQKAWEDAPPPTSKPTSLHRSRVSRLFTRLRIPSRRSRSRRRRVAPAPDEGQVAVETKD